MNRNSPSIYLPTFLLTCLIALSAAAGSHAAMAQGSGLYDSPVTAEEHSASWIEEDKDGNDFDSLFSSFEDETLMLCAGRSACSAKSQLDSPGSALSQIRAPPQP